MRVLRQGLTEAEYYFILSEQGGVCGICRGHEQRRLAVDHDHETGAIRGLLCTRCNMGLGYFLDAANVLENAISYLERHEALA